jgi:transposase-like protein
MKEEEEEVKKACPHCGAERRQMNMGYNQSGTQRRKCGLCGKTYTPSPREHAYSQEIRDAALRLLISGMSGRQVGLQLKINKANVFTWAKKNGITVDKP